MAKNWAIAIGINKYTNLQNLQFAKQDAELMRDFFFNKAGFDRVFLFTDDSPEIPAQPTPIPTQPTFGTVRRFLRSQFENPLLQPGDNLWFFFAGHGRRYGDRDYLMLSDSDPGDVENTALPVNYVTERLRRWEADNVVLFLDACRDEGSRGGLGIGEERQQGVVTFYACSPKEKSWEIEDLRQGAFTYALHEALQIQGVGNCATVERLSKYLRDRVPLVNQQYGKNPQLPYAIVEPDTKLHLILLPRFATLNDINTLKLDAFNAEMKQDWVIAWQLWIRVNAAAQGGDMEAIEAFQRIAGQRQSRSLQEESTPLRSQSSSYSSAQTHQQQESHHQPEARKSQSTGNRLEIGSSRLPPSKTLSNRIPWLSLAAVFSLYTILGAFTKVVGLGWAWVVAWAGAWAGAWVVAWAGAWAGAVAVAWVVAWAGAVAVVGWAGAAAVAVAAAAAVAVAGKDLRKSFSKHTFLILAVTSLTGLAFGLVYEVFFHRSFDSVLHQLLR